MTRLLVAAALLALLAGCLPNLSTLATPRFYYQPEGSGLLRLDPPGVGAAEARFRFNLALENDNEFQVHLAGFEGALVVNGRVARGARFLGEASIPAKGSATLALEVAVPLTATSPLLDDLSAWLAGRPLDVVITAAPVLAFGRLEQALPPVEMLVATLEPPPALTPPRLTFDARASGPREATASRAIYRVVLRAENPTPLGYVLSAPGLELELAGERLASTGAVRVALPAFAERHFAVDFVLTPAAVRALAQGAVTTVGVTPLSASVRGGVRLELPGLAELELAAGVLAQGVVR